MTKVADQEFFVRFDFQEKDANEFALAGGCIKVLHGYLCNRELNSIGVSFPHWGNESVGSSISFVSTNPNHLKQLVDQPPIRFMVNQGLIVAEQIHQIPKGCKRVKYQRCLEAERNTFGEQKRKLKRTKRRAEERGEVFIYDGVVKSLELELPHHHCIPISSSSTESSFVLFVEKVEPEEGMILENTSVSFSSYGMSSKCKYNGTVPCLTMS